MAARRSARLGALAANTNVAKSMAPPAPISRPRKRKIGVEEIVPADGDAGLASAPSTPQKRRAKKDTAPPPATPTPSVVGLMGESAGSMTPSRKPRPSAVNRLADPTLTNAVLLSPETSRVVASKTAEPISPSKVDSAGATTTATILEQACAHIIKIDARMKPLIDAHHCRIFSPEGLAEQIDPFESLASGIISQQVSGAAAKAIKGRFVALFADDDGAPAAQGTHRFPHPSQVAATSLERLRTAGLSQRKAEYLVGLAEKFTAGELSAHMLADAPYEEIVEKLTAVRGLGRWSVEMFACFGLKRMDVFSLGDLGVQRGMAAFVGRDVAKLKGKGGKWKYMGEKEMVEISERFRPYRSLFMWYMWRVEETDISTME
ncbi:DNA-3-methyladenine glycosylase [Phialemonium atrogriseum]|uniref:DNA-3-methyladenine glycosylase n=1 Tax=Phialemonium atrogriseum TaxID=1093897 RepID=A0AAJ0FS77_9PEZI|nr:DNA-3-methyladenine glycosylase [Phialemonium atrogriseum]KAK1770895.1 DNA-3-methyladenine glycosylase [Phialemonium atrogriseum]